MPLVKVFARSSLAKAVPLAPLQARLCAIWGTTPATTKLLLQRVEAWTECDEFSEDVFVDIRAKVQRAFAAHGLVANVRLQTYAGEDYFHLPPPTTTAEEAAHR